MHWFWFPQPAHNAIWQRVNLSLILSLSIGTTISDYWCILSHWFDIIFVITFTSKPNPSCSLEATYGQITGTIVKINCDRKVFTILLWNENYLHSHHQKSLWRDSNQVAVWCTQNRLQTAIRMYNICLHLMTSQDWRWDCGKKCNSETKLSNFRCISI